MSGLVVTNLINRKLKTPKQQIACVSLQDDCPFHVEKSPTPNSTVPGLTIGSCVEGVTELIPSSMLIGSPQCKIAFHTLWRFGPDVEGGHTIYLEFANWRCGRVIFNGQP